MKLTTYTDYGLRTLMFMACLSPGARSSVVEISNYYDISRNHMVKVVVQLVNLGYLNSVRGRNGGITLAKAPKDIRIGQVIRGLENNLNGVDCESPGCKLVPVCRLTRALKTGMEAFLTAMDEFTLADLVSDNAEQIIAILKIDNR
ncbi:Rrf2 family transcriptional regulator [Tolumonas auensis]|uniref:Rrf2 family transcriptional regulator n=1 Tax=Tolumonas auensis TaxID=43948 RepID=UPI002AA831A6|nr:Rrf2 family transcriptional regulator [Tolumonas auensis]